MYSFLVLSPLTLISAALGWKVERFVPNNEEAFGKLLALVKEGDERNAAPAQ